MIPLTKEEKKIHRGQRKCHICKKEFSTDDSKKKSFKVKGHCHYTGKYRGAAHKICNLIYKIPKEIPVVFHNGSTYDYHFMIKELAEKFKGQFECLGENTEKYIAFSVPIKKEITKKIRMVMISYIIKLLIALDLCQSHYQVLLIVYLMKYTMIIAQIADVILTI